MSVAVLHGVLQHHQRPLAQDVARQRRCEVLDVLRGQRRRYAADGSAGWTSAAEEELMVFDSDGEQSERGLPDGLGQPR